MSDSPASIASLHSGSDEKPYNNYDSHKCSLPIPIPKPPLPQKLGNRRLQINPSYFKVIPDSKEYKYYFGPNLKSNQ